MKWQSTICSHLTEWHFSIRKQWDWRLKVWQLARFFTINNFDIDVWSNWTLSKLFTLTSFVVLLLSDWCFHLWKQCRYHIDEDKSFFMKLRKTFVSSMWKFTWQMTKFDQTDFSKFSSRYFQLKSLLWKALKSEMIFLTTKFELICSMKQNAPRKISHKWQSFNAFY